jgi:hypothetical protein
MRNEVKGGVSERRCVGGLGKSWSSSGEEMLEEIYLCQCRNSQAGPDLLLLLWRFNNSFKWTRARVKKPVKRIVRLR